MTDFDNIRPYDDAEVREVLDRILADPELANAISKLKFPRLHSYMGWLLRPLVRWVLNRQLSQVHTVADFQHVVERYMSGMIGNTTTALTISGLDQLDPKGAYLFISNHRDITMDPAFVNWSLYHSEANTLRIAIGDNLLTKPYVSDLMRLNKSFIVNRSAKAPREKFKAARQLSAYIHHSIVNDAHNIWIAQREGRAKDGKDKTNSAVIGMLTLNKPKTMDFNEYVHALNIVPVSISYEYDPCDAAKARELYQQKTTGSYQKEEHEDVKSIAAGITGQKGHVHVAFGDVLKGHYADDDDVVREIDRQVIANYVLHSSNCFAWQMLGHEAKGLRYSDQQIPFDADKLPEAKAAFEARMAAIPDAWRDIALAMYANPVLSQQSLQVENAS